MTTPSDVELVQAILKLAAGQSVADRVVTPKQYGLLCDHRVLGLVPPSWQVPEDHNLRRDKRNLAGQQLQLQAEAKQVVAQLVGAGIECRVLKGMASCELDYDSPAERHFGDVDLLVRPADFLPAINTLEGFGATSRVPGRSGYLFEIEATLLTPAGTEVDLHYRLTRFASDHADRVFADPVPLPAVGGYALSDELRLLHAAAHVSYTPPGSRRLSGVADISAIRARHDVDLDRVRRHAAALDCEAMVGLALGIERTLANLPSDTDHWVQPSRLERASFARAERQMLLEHVLAMSKVEGAANRARYLWHWAVPTPQAAERRGGLFRYFQRALPARLGGQYFRKQPRGEA